MPWAVEGWKKWTWKIWAWFKERNRSSASGALDRGMRGSWVSPEQGFFHCFTLVSLQFLPLLASFLMFMHPKACVLQQFQSPKSPKRPHSEAREKEQVFLCLIPKPCKACLRNFIEAWGPDGVLINQDQGTTWCTLCIIFLCLQRHTHARFAHRHI